METAQIRAKLLEDTERYAPSAPGRCPLSPYRDIILMQRAKFMSYEQIAAMFVLRGLPTSETAVGRFCRSNITRAQLARARAELRLAKRTPAATTGPAGLPASSPQPKLPGFDQVGPKIARDDF
jgi:hypothetical protein